MMNAKVFVSYKESVFDPQGNTVQEALSRLGFQEVRGVRVGKCIEIRLEETDRKRAEVRLREMCEKLLHNPVIESYRWEIS